MATNLPEDLNQGLNLKNYQFVKKLGAGSFGTVYEVIDQKGEKKAIKIVNGDDPDVSREVDAHKMENIDNLYIVKCFNTWSENISLLDGAWKSEIDKLPNLMKDVTTIQVFEFELCAG